jgi:hypothetical protein
MELLRLSNLATLTSRNLVEEPILPATALSSKLKRATKMLALFPDVKPKILKRYKTC